MPAEAHEPRPRRRDIDATSDVIDAAIEAGGDDARLAGIRFRLDDEQQHADDAREQAVADARARAEALAAAAGVTLGEPQFISESTSPAAPPRIAVDEAAPETDVETPIDPGRQDIEVHVSMVFAIQ